ARACGRAFLGNLKDGKRQPIGMSNVRYRIEGVLGAGGSGLVHKAFDEVERRFVAIKRLAPGAAATPADRHRQQALLEREFYVLAELAHPKVIRVYDYGIDDDGPYYTMEWLKGQRLRKLTPLPFQKACSL